MVHRNAATVDEYLSQLPEDRRDLIVQVLEWVRRHIPEGYEETIAFGMIGWVIPLDRYPDTYNGQPLGVVSLAAQKHHNALYLMGSYADPELDGRIHQAYRAAGKRLDMGKSCVRFKRWDQLVPEVLADVIEAVPPERFIALYERAQNSPRNSRTARR
jgi:uncharacterized protein YdhG (YjbR/CyaY superfamily)